MLSRLQKVLWGLVVISAIASGLLLLGEARRDEDQEASAGQGFRARFELTDHMGVLRSEKDYSGRWMLVFFGYANCPDVCPMTLSEKLSGIGEWILRHTSGLLDWLMVFLFVAALVFGCQLMINFLKNADHQEDDES